LVAASPRGANESFANGAFARPDRSTRWPLSLMAVLRLLADVPDPRRRLDPGDAQRPARGNESRTASAPLAVIAVGAALLAIAR